jgi:predicted DNA-binding transcriptional regulator AlpA
MGHMIPNSATPERRVLHSWKEIATYTGRGVRTVQRYELQYGFPVRRPAGGPRSAVLALSSEIDQWLAKSPKRPESPTPEDVASGRVASLSMCDKIRAAHRNCDAVKEQASSALKQVETAKNLCDRLNTTWQRTLELQQRITLRFPSVKAHKSMAVAAPSKN